nr:MAG TPA: hypothetical protein [Caudoviricetes sp.]
MVKTMFGLGFQMYYSPVLGGFYCKEIHGDFMPVDCVAISDELYELLMQGSAEGMAIIPDDKEIARCVSQAEARALREAANPTALQKSVEEIEALRQEAYRKEADPLFFKAQRGRATMEEWRAKIAEIKKRYPSPIPGADDDASEEVPDADDSADTQDDTDAQSSPDAGGGMGSSGSTADTDAAAQPGDSNDTGAGVDDREPPATEAASEAHEEPPDNVGPAGASDAAEAPVTEREPEVGPQSETAPEAEANAPATAEPEDVPAASDSASSESEAAGEGDASAGDESPAEAPAAAGNKDAEAMPAEEASEQGEQPSRDAALDGTAKASGTPTDMPQAGAPVGR